MIPDSPQVVHDTIKHHYIVSVEDDANLTVTIRAYPPPTTVTWTVLTSGLQKSGSIVPQVNDVYLVPFIVHHVDIDKYGTYMCDIGNGIGENLYINMTVCKEGKYFLYLYNIITINLFFFIITIHYYFARIYVCCKN